MNKTWKEIEKKAKECQKWWGMGFPVISLELLKPLFDRAIKQAVEEERKRAL